MAVKTKKQQEKHKLMVRIRCIVLAVLMAGSAGVAILEALIR